MRIIGSISHPTLKISVFRSENRISVKFENALYEQTFKMGDDERFSSMEAVEKLVDGEMIADVMASFQRLHAVRLSALSRQFPAEDAGEFEEII